jgi:hypothetical protein
MRTEYATRAIVVAMLLTLVSCATGTKFTALQPKTTPDTADLGRIFFYRPSSFGAALRPSVQLNGEKVGEAISQGFFYVDRPPGEYEVVTQTEVKRKVSFVLEKGQTRFIRFSTSMGFFAGHVYGQLVEQDIAMKEIKECKYTGSR